MLPGFNREGASSRLFVARLQLYALKLARERPFCLCLLLLCAAFSIVFISCISFSILETSCKILSMPGCNQYHFKKINIYFCTLQTP